jgi:opacity protein-like surface antigen
MDFMNKYLKILFLSSLLSSSTVFASIKPIMTLTLGADIENTGKTTTNITFLPPFYNTYAGTNQSQPQVLGGIFLGAEFDLASNWATQVGISYYQSSTDIPGDIYQFGLPAYNNLSYTYNITSRRLLAETKLLYAFKSIYHPYIDVGIGEAFNQSNNYSEFPTVSSSVPMPSSFGNNSTNHFTYIAGLGVDVDINKNLRVGAGYRYANFGNTRLGTSPLQADTNTLYTHAITSNEVLFQLSAIVN